jgi:hypothetical protein
MIITVVSYWLIGLPFGYWLCFHRDLGPEGLWIGIIGGLAVAGVLLVRRFARLSRQGRKGLENIYLDSSTAFNRSPVARIGHLTDCLSVLRST